MSAISKLLDPLRHAVAAFFKHDLALRRDDSGLQIVLEPKVENGVKKKPKKGSREDAVQRKDQQELALVLEQLHTLLSELPETRQTMRPLVFVEQALNKKGLRALHKLPLDVLQDPMYFRSGGVDPGRDGCRVPLPWSGTSEPYGFSPDGSSARPWLPQPATWAQLTVAAQEADPASTLHLYRDLLAIRRCESALGDGPTTWIDTPDDVLAFARGDLVCVVNLGDEPAALPAHTDVLLASDPLVAGLLPRDTAAWLRTPA